MIRRLISMRGDSNYENINCSLTEFGGFGTILNKKNEQEMYGCRLFNFMYICSSTFTAASGFGGSDYLVK